MDYPMSLWTWHMSMNNAWLWAHGIDVDSMFGSTVGSGIRRHQTSRPTKPKAMIVFDRRDGVTSLSTRRRRWDRRTTLNPEASRTVRISRVALFYLSNRSRWSLPDDTWQLEAIIASFTHTSVVIRPSRKPIRFVKWSSWLRNDTVGQSIVGQRRIVSISYERMVILELCMGMLVVYSLNLNRLENVIRCAQERWVGCIGYTEGWYKLCGKRRNGNMK